DRQLFRPCSPPHFQVLPAIGPMYCCNSTATATAIETDRARMQLLLIGESSEDADYHRNLLERNGDCHINQHHRRARKLRANAYATLPTTCRFATHSSLPVKARFYA